MIVHTKLALAAVAVAVAGFVAVPVMAQEATSEPAQETAISQAHRQGRFDGAFVDVVLEVTGLSRGEVISLVREGATLADLAEANGSSGDALVGALMAVVDERIDAATADGRLDDSQAAQLRLEAEERIDRAVFDTKPHRPGLGGELRRDFMHAIEGELGLNQGRIVSHVRTGGTLAELADEHGSSGDSLVAVLVDVVDQRVQQALSEGLIDEQRASEILADAEERLMNAVFEPHSPGRR